MLEGSSGYYPIFASVANTDAKCWECTHGIRGNSVIERTLAASLQRFPFNGTLTG